METFNRLHRPFLPLLSACGLLTVSLATGSAATFTNTPATISSAYRLKVEP